MVSVLLLQAFGAVAYLVAPAAGPFIYEKGVDPTITGGQQYMLDFYRNSIAQGPAWIAGQGGANFTAGLAAMPSLHARRRLPFLPVCVEAWPGSPPALFVHPVLYPCHLGCDPLALCHRRTDWPGARLGLPAGRRKKSACPAKAEPDANPLPYRFQPEPQRRGAIINRPDRPDGSQPNSDTGCAGWTRAGREWRAYRRVARRGRESGSSP